MWNRLSHYVVWVAYSAAFFGIAVTVWGATLPTGFHRRAILARVPEIAAIAACAGIAGWLALELTARVRPRLLRRADPEQAADYDDPPPTP